MSYHAAALAHPNIAFIKYWGNRDHSLRLPSNGSISMNLDGLFTHTQVTFDPAFPSDSLVLNGLAQAGPPLQRVSQFLDHVRALSALQLFAVVVSDNNFPTGAGIASSSAAFAALSLASTQAAGLDLSQAHLSRLARLGSGSACRSVPGGFVEWYPGTGDADSYAVSIAPPTAWDLVDCIAILQTQPKLVGSTQGHSLADTSPLQAARVADAPRRLDLCRAALCSRDFDALAAILELDSNLLHAVMLTSTPALFYWEPASLAIMKAVQNWRNQGHPVCFTLDAGPNVHVITPSSNQDWLIAQLHQFPAVSRVFVAAPGGPAHRIDG